MNREINLCKVSNNAYKRINQNHTIRTFDVSIKLRLENMMCVFQQHHCCYYHCHGFQTKTTQKKKQKKIRIEIHLFIQFRLDSLA